MFSDAGQRKRGGTSKEQGRYGTGGKREAEQGHIRGTTGEHKMYGRGTQDEQQVYSGGTAEALHQTENIYYRLLLHEQ